MLIEFKFRNYRSFKDETRLIMTPVKSFKEHINTHIISNKNINLLKTSAIYGSNGGGKSNFISAMGFMRNYVHNSFSDSLKKEEDRISKGYFFKLSEETETQPTFFEISFIINETIYRYGYEIKGYEIISEWLYKKIDVETLMFERNKKDFKINNNSFKEGNKHKNEVNSNVLFISHLAQYNSKEATNVINWFRRLNVVNSLSDKHYENVTAALLDEVPEFKPWLSLII
jgi:AAA15 family ATPase/GTPase